MTRQDWALPEQRDKTRWPAPPALLRRSGSVTLFFSAPTPSLPSPDISRTCGPSRSAASGGAVSSRVHKTVGRSRLLSRRPFTAGRSQASSRLTSEMLFWEGGPPGQIACRRRDWSLIGPRLPGASAVVHRRGEELLVAGSSSQVRRPLQPSDERSPSVLSGSTRTISSSCFSHEYLIPRGWGHTPLLILMKCDLVGA